jgi:hypothetical protein
MIGRVGSRQLITAFIMLLLAGNAHAILLTPPAKEHKFTIGFTELWFHRDQEWTNGWGVDEDKFNLGAVYAKYGVVERLTLYAEFAIYNGDPHNQGISYRHINLGGGFNAVLFRTHDIDVSVLFNYFENFQHDNQESMCHSTTHHWAGLIQLTQTYEFSENKHEMAAWIGPGYFRDEQIYDGGACTPSEKRSVDNVGLALGVNFLFWDHLETFAHVIYANYLQPRLGIGYQF